MLQLALILALCIFFSPLLGTEQAVCPVCTCLRTQCVYGFPHSNQPLTLSKKTTEEMKLVWLEFLLLNSVDT